MTRKKAASRKEMKPAARVEPAPVDVTVKPSPALAVRPRLQVSPAETKDSRPERRLGEVNFVRSAVPQATTCSICGGEVFIPKYQIKTQHHWAGVTIVVKMASGRVYEEEWTLCGGCTKAVDDALTERRLVHGNKEWHG